MKTVSAYYQKHITIFNSLFLIFFLYLFLFSLELMGASLKMFGKDLAETLIETTTNPLVGLFIGILVTSIVQSSSSTTSIVVGLVAGGALNVSNAIPIIMGANMGTSVTWRQPVFMIFLMPWLLSLYSLCSISRTSWA